MAIMGNIARCMMLANPNKNNLVMPWEYRTAIKRIVKAIPDLIFEENKTCTLGVKKTIKTRGKKYIKYFWDLILVEKI